MADKIIRDVPSEEGMGNIVLWIIVVVLIWAAIWAVASGRLSLNNENNDQPTNVNVQVDTQTGNNSGNMNDTNSGMTNEWDGSGEKDMTVSGGIGVMDSSPNWQ